MEARDGGRLCLRATLEGHAMDTDWLPGLKGREATRALKISAERLTQFLSRLCNLYIP